MTSTDDRRLSSAGSSTGVATHPHSAPSWQRGYARWLSVTDFGSALGAVAVAHWSRIGLSSGTLGPVRTISYLQVSIVITVAWLAALAISNSRSQRVIGSGVEEYRRVWMATISVFGAVAVISMLFKLEIGRGYLMIALPTGIILLFGSRWAARRWLIRSRIRHGKCITRMLAVGSVPAVRDVVQSLAREPEAGFIVVGACVPDAGVTREIKVPGLTPIPVLGDESQVVEAVIATSSHAVAVNPTERLDGRGMRDLSWQLEKLDVDLVVAPGVVDVAGPRMQMRPVAGLPLLHLEKPQYHGAKRFQKRLFDILFSSSVLFLGFPVLLTIAIAIKLTSKGPVFYRRRCIGYDEQIFDMIKFRTMVDGADALAADLLKLELVASPRDPLKFVDDPRVTPVGKFLRKYSIDELPQFINVLKREMSVVGPRPQVSSELDACDEYAKRRLLVRPGITGLWQVSGRSDLSPEDSVRLDLFYVENWSMLVDLSIALKTLTAVFRHSGAY